MRADLVARGLLDADFNVTPAGEAYTDQLLTDLKSAQPPEPPAASVRWNTGKGKA